ncbi:MAG: hypothetical protein KC944_14560 [Candidatus Omnitrophica bacterium]|nr:hypothetical protein [Candidatus Omnitrophota bacterium]
MKKETRLLDYWPILLGATVMITTPLFLILDTPEVPDQSIDLMVRHTMTEPPPGDELRLSDSAEEEPQKLVNESLRENPAPASPSTESNNQPSELEIRTADWRYVGAILSENDGIAVIERMRYPERKLKVAEGEKLEGVSVEEVASESVRLTLEDESRELLLTQGPAFKVTEVMIPEETLEDPEILAAVVFAQTLGKYVAGEPDFSSIENPIEPEGDSLHEMMEAISQAGNLIPPMGGESNDDWGAAASEAMSSNPESSMDPSQYPLTEEARLSFFGYDRLVSQK